MSRDDIPVPMDLSQSLVLADSMEGDELVNSAYSHSLNASQVDLTVDGDGTGASKMIIDDEDLESDGFEDEHLAIRSNLFDGCLLDPQQLQVVKEIGEGAFSTIFLAKMSQTGELVAVKKANIQIKSRFPPEVMFCREVSENNVGLSLVYFFLFLFLLFFFFLFFFFSSVLSRSSS
jgi:hypothetical protein